MTVRFRTTAFGSAALIVLGLALAGCGGSPRTSATGPSGELPDQEVTDFVITETDQGHVQWTLYARDAAMYDAKNLVVARGVRVDFFDEKGKQSSELKADQGELNQQTRDMTARGHVVMATAEGTRMTTSELHFDNQTQKIRSDKLVRVERQGDVLSGTGFESDQDLHHFEFKSQVNATVHTRSGAIIETRGKK